MRLAAAGAGRPRDAAPALTPATGLARELTPARESGAEPARVEPAVPEPANAPEETNVWPDEAAESAFLAEAKQRGEPVAVAAPNAEPEETDPKSLPALDDLVQRIPAGTRELLDELFRARFTTVRKVRKADLKSS